MNMGPTHVVQLSQVNIWQSVHAAFLNKINDSSLCVLTLKYILLYLMGPTPKLGYLEWYWQSCCSAVQVNWSLKTEKKQGWKKTPARSQREEARTRRKQDQSGGQVKGNWIWWNRLAAESGSAREREHSEQKTPPQIVQQWRAGDTRHR